MQNITALLDDAKSFPQNLDRRNPSYYNRSLREQLNEHAERLFAKEDVCSLHFLELSSRGKGTDYVALKELPPRPRTNQLSRFLAHVSQNGSPSTDTPWADDHVKES